MSDPIIDSTDLGIYLNDPDIDATRAEFFIGQAQKLCESVVSPLPDGAEVVVTRVAGRAYTTVTSTRQQQLAAAGNPYGGGGSSGGVFIDEADEADLRRITGTVDAFTIRLRTQRPRGYGASAWTPHPVDFYGLDPIA